MKKINKPELPPDFFNNFINDNKPNNWADCSEIRAELRSYILKEEQNGQCAYCESSITSDISKSHIDHYKRKAGHLFPELECTYDNLLVSCNSNENGKNLHCAKSKDIKMKTREEYQNLINPVLDNPKVHFEFSYTGEVIALDEKGIYTRDVFNINHPKLVNKRKLIAYAFKDYRDQEFSLDEVKGYFGEYDSFIENIWKS